jgi:hypothetical protein
LVPKAPIDSYAGVNAANAPVLCELLQIAPLAARLVSPPITKYGLIMNGGSLQDVQQLHFHLVSPMDPVDTRRVHLTFRPAPKSRVFSDHHEPRSSPVSAT